MNDMRAVIVPKSDQINADNLLGGPMTITITKVTIRPGTEQPVSIHFEGDDGKPWKPCKSMARVLVQLWGPDANEYVGRSVTIYNDPKVLWGGMAVGGIRISHMTHINEAVTMALTATKGSKKPFTVKPLKAEAPKARSVRDVLRDLLDGATTRADVEAAMELPSVAKILKDGLENQRAILRAMIGEALARFPETSATNPESETSQAADQADPFDENADLPPDADADWTADFIGQIRAAKSAHALTALGDNAAVKSRIGKLKEARPELYQAMVDADAARREALSAKAA